MAHHRLHLCHLAGCPNLTRCTVLCAVDLCACTVLQVWDLIIESQKQAAVLRCSAVAICLCGNSRGCTTLQVCGMTSGGSEDGCCSALQGSGTLSVL